MWNSKNSGLMNLGCVGTGETNPCSTHSWTFPRKNVISVRAEFWMQILFVRPVRKYLSSLYANAVCPTCTRILFVKPLRKYCLSNLNANTVCPTWTQILFALPVRKYLSNLYANTDCPTCTQKLCLRRVPTYSLFNLYANTVCPTCTQNLFFPTCTHLLFVQPVR